MKRYRIVHQNTGIEVPEGEFLVGRSAGCHLVLDDPSVSRVHAAFLKLGERIAVVDKGSRNGIKVNGVRAEDEVELKDGDLVSIGHQRIRVMALEASSESDKTMGMTRCKSCRGWLKADESECPVCGSGADDTMVYEVAEAHQQNPQGRSKAQESWRATSSVVETQPVAMMCGIATKTLRLGQTEEATRLLESILRMAEARAEAGKKLPDDELQAISTALMTFTEVTRKPEHISQLFALYCIQHRLLGREQVERLYDIVRIAGYRSCPGLSRYLTMLDDMARSFSPGERFIHRRIQGLVKICS